MSQPGEQPGQPGEAPDAALQRFATLYELSPVGIALADQEGIIFEANPALTTLLNRGVEELRGAHLKDLVTGEEDSRTLNRAVTDAGQHERSLDRERMRLRIGQDEEGLCGVTLFGISGNSPGTTFPVLMVEDVDELHLLQTTLREQNVSDQLTGLANSAGFNGQLNKLRQLGHDRRVALVYLDIDGFKMINDGLGREAADQILVEVASRLHNGFTRFDPELARIAGDGFTVLLHGSKEDIDAAGVTNLVNEVMESLNEPLYLADRGIGVSVSAGIAVSDAPVTETTELLRSAEITVHRAKRRGKAQWMLSEPGLDASDREQFELGAVIAGGLEQGEFGLEHEPTIKLDGSGRIMVINSSLRWNHPERGVLQGNDFYPLADTTGMTHTLGKWLLDASIAEAADWSTRFGRDVAPDLCVRLPNRLTTDPGLVHMVREQLERHELQPSKVRLCADSTALRDPYGEAPESLDVLAELDVKIALAVTGAADLELIRAQKLPVGFLMLSESLVASVESSSIHLTSLVRRAHELGLHRIGAEGVHSGKQAELLHSLGVIAGRGTLFGEAVDSAQVERMLHQRTSGY